MAADNSYLVRKILADKDPKAKQAQPKDFVDTSLLDEIAKAAR